LFKEKSLLLHPILISGAFFAPLQTLQGRVEFPIGGKVRKLTDIKKLISYGTNRCNYGTDSIVWMEED